MEMPHFLEGDTTLAGRVSRCREQQHALAQNRRVEPGSTETAPNVRGLLAGLDNAAVAHCGGLSSGFFSVVAVYLLQKGAGCSRGHRNLHLLFRDLMFC